MWLSGLTFLTCKMRAGPSEILEVERPPAAEASSPGLAMVPVGMVARIHPICSGCRVLRVLAYKAGRGELPLRRSGQRTE